MDVVIVQPEPVRARAGPFLTPRKKSIGTTPNRPTSAVCLRSVRHRGPNNNHCFPLDHNIFLLPSPYIFSIHSLYVYRGIIMDNDKASFMSFPMHIYETWSGRCSLSERLGPKVVHNFQKIMGV